MKMFNITNHQGSANQNHTEISSHIHQDGYYLKKKTKKENKYWPGCREIGTLVHCGWECTMMNLLQKTVCQFIKKVKIDLEIPLLGIYSKELKSGSQRRDICVPMFTAASLTRAMRWKEPKCPFTDGWVNKIVTDTYNARLFSFTKGRKLLTYVTMWMNSEDN